MLQPQTIVTHKTDKASARDTPSFNYNLSRGVLLVASDYKVHSFCLYLNYFTVPLHPCYKTEILNEEFEDFYLRVSISSRLSPSVIRLRDGTTGGSESEPVFCMCEELHTHVQTS